MRLHRTHVIGKAQQRELFTWAAVAGRGQRSAQVVAPLTLYSVRERAETTGAVERVQVLVPKGEAIPSGPRPHPHSQLGLASPLSPSGCPGATGGRGSCPSLWEAQSGRRSEGWSQTGSWKWHGVPGIVSPSGPSRPRKLPALVYPCRAGSPGRHVGGVVETHSLPRA